MILRLSRNIHITVSVLGGRSYGTRTGATGVKVNQKIAGTDGGVIPKIDASTLLASGKEIILVHKDTQYRLRLTSNDKLILTK